MNSRALCAISVVAVAVGGYVLWPETTPVTEASGRPAEEAETSQAQVAKADPTPAVPAQDIELTAAVEQKSIVVECTGNGRDRMAVLVMNKSDVPLRVHVPVAQTFECERNLMIAVRPASLEIPGGKTAEMTVETAAVRSTNKVLRGAYRVSTQTSPRIDLFLTYVQQHPEMTVATIQTAILALTDNLPLSAVAKFQMAGGALPSRFNTDAFRVETHDILAALAALKELGIKDYQIAMTIDPQLRIEAMIDPLSRAIAMRYYSITTDAEWGFWKNELLNGDPSTRHYALYGIARFYPEVALEMLPKWVRETRTNPVYRLSAAQALADTQKPEALPILRQLVNELGENTELGKAANTAAEYLDYRLSQLAAAQTKVAFRTTNREAAF